MSGPWLSQSTSTIKIEISHPGHNLDLTFVVPPEVMMEALTGIDYAKERDAIARMLATGQSDADRIREMRERIADTARRVVLDMLSKGDTVNGYPPG